MEAGVMKESPNRLRGAKGSTRGEFTARHGSRGQSFEDRQVAFLVLEITVCDNINEQQ